jgi:hypothetical protein
MKNSKTDWKVVLVHSDLNIRHGKHEEPEVIGTEKFDFEGREEAIAKFNESINYYESISFDMKGHSKSEVKVYHETDGKEILTYIFLYYKGRPYEGLKDEELA